MLQKNLLLALRSLTKRGRNNGIKILSLAVGLAMGLVLIAKVCFEQSYDTFYPDADRIYRLNEMIVQNNMRGGMTDMTFLIRKDRLDDAIPVCRTAAEAIKAQGVSFNTEVASLSIQGQELSSTPEVTARMFATLASVNVNIEMITSSAFAVTCVVDATAVERAVAALQKAFDVEAVL